MISELAELAVLLCNRRLPPERLRELQDRKLRAVICHAYGAVPYYRELFDGAGVAPGDIRSVDDLRHIPITTKEAMKAAGLPRLLSRGTNLSACVRSRTTGTEGVFFDSWHHRTEARTRRLLGFRKLREAGYGPGDRLVVFGTVSVPSPRVHHRMGWFRAHHLPITRPAEEYFDMLRGVQPSILKSWPSILRLIRLAAPGELEAAARPRAVFTSSEVCGEPLRRWIQDTLKAEPFDAYVASEVGEIAWECRAHSGLHVNANHLIVECLDARDRPCEPGELGAAVVTSLHGTTMPFLRYRMDDTASLIAGPCPCGCSFPRMHPPAGRVNELIRLPSGAWLSSVNVFVSLRDRDDIHQMQLIQERVDRFLLRLVPVTRLSPEQLADVRSAVLQSFGEPVELDVQAVEAIPEVPGKHHRFVSTLLREEPCASATATGTVARPMAIDQVAGPEAETRLPPAGGRPSM